eukprot:5824872-Pleurochrysis_carterae.AAC.1
MSASTAVEQTGEMRGLRLARFQTAGGRNKATTNPPNASLVDAGKAQYSHCRKQSSAAASVKP